MSANLATPLVVGHREAIALFLELESLAHLPGDDDGIVERAAAQAWNAYVALQAEAREAQQDLQAEARAALQALLERATLLAASELQRDQLTTELAAHTAALESARTELLQARNGALESAVAVSQLQHENASFRAENELLFSQLQQVQEELDAQMAPVLAPEPVVAAPSDREFTVDMRGEIDGDNWYYAEHDGRWAGPANVSTVRVPVLRDGDYELRLDVVDAKDKKILAGMTLALNGMDLKPKHNGRGVKGLVTARFSANDIPRRGRWELQFRFPKLISPAQHGSADARMLAIRLRSLQLVPLS